MTSVRGGTHPGTRRPRRNWRDGDRPVIEPVPKDGLLDLLAGLPPLPDEFPDVDATLQPLDDVKV